LQGVAEGIFEIVTGADLDGLWSRHTEAEFENDNFGG
jgi:hypothetical protein